MPGLLIKNGTVVNDDFSFPADILIEGGTIKDVGLNLRAPPEYRTIDATGKLVIPGGIDTHTHMQRPLSGHVADDDFFTGARAALAGGTTMIIDFVIPEKGESLLGAYEKWRGWADPKVCCDYSLHVAVTWWAESISKEMEILCTEKGINSFKVFMAYKDVLMVEDAIMYKVFKRSKELRALPMVHAENGHLIAIKSDELFEAGVKGPEGHIQSRPEVVEEEATQRAITIAHQAGSPLYVVHVMSKRAADVVVKSRQNGQIVFGEPIAPGLGKDGTNYFHKYWRHAAGHVMAPPLRPDPTTPAYLMDRLANDDLHLTGTNHCTFNSKQKAAGRNDFRQIPHGVNGVEERMAIVWEKGVVTGKLDMCRYVAVTSTTAAKIFNIYPRKGRIAIGSDADIVVWNPDATQTISSATHHINSDFNIFEGQTYHGVPEFVITNGQVAVDNGELKAVRGSGKFVPTPTNAQFVYGRVDCLDRVNQPVIVEREPEDGRAGSASNHTRTGQIASGFHHHPLTPNGVRNMQDSSFALNGSQIDDDTPKRSSTKISNPPGGKSSALW